MAEYRDHYAELRAAGAEVAALSVDEPARSRAVADDLKLPFTLLCDPRREVVTAFGVFNRAEKGGIAIPSVFVIDRAMVVRFRVLETVGTRVNPGDLVEIVRSVKGGAEPQALPRPARVWPGAMFLRATLNSFRRGIRQR